MRDADQHRAQRRRRTPPSAEHQPSRSLAEHARRCCSRPDAVDCDPRRARSSDRAAMPATTAPAGRRSSHGASSMTPSTAAAVCRCRRSQPPDAVDGASHDHRARELADGGSEHAMRSIATHRQRHAAVRTRSRSSSVRSLTATVRRTPGISCEAVPASMPSTGAGMRRHCPMPAQRMPPKASSASSPCSTAPSLRLAVRLHADVASRAATMQRCDDRRALRRRRSLDRPIDAAMAAALVRRAHDRLRPAARPTTRHVRSLASDSRRSELASDPRRAARPLVATSRRTARRTAPRDRRRSSPATTAERRRHAAASSSADPRLPSRADSRDRIAGARRLAVASPAALAMVRRTPGISCEAVPASMPSTGAGMRRHVRCWQPCRRKLRQLHPLVRRRSSLLPTTSVASDVAPGSMAACQIVRRESRHARCATATMRSCTARRNAVRPSIELRRLDEDAARRDRASCDDRDRAGAVRASQPSTPRPTVDARLPTDQSRTLAADDSGRCDACEPRRTLPAQPARVRD